MISFSKSLTTKDLVKHWTTACTFKMFPMNFSSSKMTTTQSPSYLVWDKKHLKECFVWTIPINRLLPFLCQTFSAAFLLSPNNIEQDVFPSFWWVSNHSLHLQTWFHSVCPITKHESPSLRKFLPFLQLPTGWR